MDATRVLDGGGVFYYKDNKGNYANDGFDKNLYNSDLYTVKNYETGEWANWAMIVGRDNLEDGDECFVEYGKDAWTYRPNFNQLPDDQKVKCMSYYQIKDSEFWEDEIIREDLASRTITTVDGSSTDTSAQIQKAVDAAKKKQFEAAVKDAEATRKNEPRKKK